MSYRAARRWRARLLAAATGLAVSAAGAESAPLPQPLGLGDALSMAGAPHYDVLLGKAQVDAAEARQAAIEAGYGWEVRAEGQLRFVDPNEEASDLADHRDDHQLGIYASKRLWDAGRRDALEGASAAEVDSAEQGYVDRLQQRRLEIMRRFFDVLLADIEYRVINERMAIEFIDFDKVEDRSELGEINDVDLLAAEAEYQEVLARRTAAANRQRTTRQALAEILDRPEEVPAELVPPDFGHLFDRERGELEAIIEKALENNPRIQALQKAVEAAQGRIEAARRSGRPSLDLELAANAYRRDLSGRDDLQAGLRLNVPLYRGGRVAAAVAEARAEKLRAQARLAEARRDIRQRALELWQQIADLQARRESDWVRFDYREIYLDRARSLYDLEVATDLGDALVEHTRARFRMRQTEFAMALAWAELQALMGRTVSALEPEE